MPRRVQDIVPGDRRSIRNIPLNRDKEAVAEHLEPRKTKRSAKEEEAPTPKSEEPTPTHSARQGREIPIRRIPITPPAPRAHKKKGGKKWLITGIILIALVAGAAWAASTYFSKATFTIIPKSSPVIVNGTFIAQGTSGGPLSYELVTIHGSTSTTVASTNSAPVSTKAQGTVTLFNTNSSAQLLVAGTRLSDADGTIYRLKSSVTIPARTSAAPGSITTSIVADQAGASSNISRTDTISDFKIVAYKGTAKYDTIYARLASDVSGGFTGTKKVVDPKALASTSASLAAQLTRQLLDQARTSMPDGHIMYDDVRIVSFAEPTVSGNDPKRAIVGVQGTLTAIFFEEKQLVERLAGKDKVAPFEGFSYTTPGLENLEVVIANTKDFSPQKKNSLILRVKGNMKIVGTVPVDQIRAKLAGTSLEDMRSIFKSYSAVIETGSGEVSPPWVRVPSDPKRISIVIKEE